MPVQHVWEAGDTFPLQMPSTRHRCSRASHHPFSAHAATSHHQTSNKASWCSASHGATRQPPARRTSHRTSAALWGLCHKCPLQNASPAGVCCYYLTLTLMLFVTLVCMGLTPYILHSFLCLRVTVFEHCKFAREYTHEVLNFTP